MNNARIIFYAPDNIICSSGILKSQVLGPARFLSSIGAKCLVISSESNKESALEAKRMIQRDYSLKACVLSRSMMKVPFLSNWLLCQEASARLDAAISAFEPTHIYTRSLLAFGTASGIASRYRLKHIHDLRGVVAVEAMQQQRWLRGHVYSAGLHFLENNALRKADRLSCVSYRLGSWIESRCGRTDYAVIPGCVSDNDHMLYHADKRKSIRERFGFSEQNKVLCYAGSSAAKWQRIHSIIKLCRDMSEINTLCRFLFLTPQTSVLEDIIKDIGPDSSKCHVISCDQSTVATYLKAGDAGIILRDDTLINNVACPTKIGEYLSAGLPVLLSRNIGDMSELVETHHVGLIVEDRNFAAEQVVKYLDDILYEDMFAKCKQFVDRYLTWNAYLKEFETLYK